MKVSHTIPRTPYEGCTASFEEAEFILIGAGYDGTSSYRPGSRFAPQAIRSETLLSQENYSPYFRKDLTEKAIHDAGDLDLPFGNKDKALQYIEEAAQLIFSSDKTPCFIGGEHLISLPVITAATRKFPDLRIIQLDAHLDLMDELFGDTISHGTVMRRVWDMFQEKDRIYQIGIRSGSKEEFEFAEQNTRLFPFSTEEFLSHINELKDVPVYLSVDLDVFDPSLIPGTGTPEAGGIFFQEFIRFLTAIQNLYIVGCDLVELSPTLDLTGASTIVAAKILRELLIIL
ncbi:MAG: agmatinase [Methanobacteriota archaeon]|nr:MAG: agmatinase [Euryarchaeota archaeon]